MLGSCLKDFFLPHSSATALFPLFLLPVVHTPLPVLCTLTEDWTILPPYYPVVMPYVLPSLQVGKTWLPA